MIPGMRRHPVSSTVLERAAVVDMFRGTALLGCFWILGAFYYNVDMVILQRPGTGLPPSMLSHVVGRSVRMDIPAGALIQLDMFS